MGTQFRAQWIGARIKLTGTTSVAVVTLTRDRPLELRRNLESVRRQIHPNVTQYVVGDRCSYMGEPNNLRELRKEFPGVVFACNNERLDDYLPTHLARLRYAAVRESGADAVAILDDDNEYEPEHLSSLVAVMELQNAAAAHSWRSLWSASDSPWLVVDKDPWVADERLAKISFDVLSRYGILESGSNIVRDSLSYDDRPGRIDSNEWLLSRSLFEAYAVPHEASPAERRMQFTEDVLLSRKLIADSVEVACSQRATVRYYMGGYSNHNYANVAIERIVPAHG